MEAQQFERQSDIAKKVDYLHSFIQSAAAEAQKPLLLSYLQDLACQNQSYGLSFKHYLELPLKRFNHIAPSLCLNPALSINAPPVTPQSHMLIEGDNLLALTLLSQAHCKTIDLILIDPPYNRGKNDLSYDDHFKHTGDGDPHSRWLSFFYNRAAIARELLKDTGYLFINIDDNELCQLKLLCDTLFGSDNFVGIYLWEKTATPPALSSKIRKRMEYILCYAKKLDKKHRFIQGAVDGFDAPLLNSANNSKTLHFPIGSVKFQLPDGRYDAQRVKLQLKEPVLVKNGRNLNTMIATGAFKWTQSKLAAEIAAGTYFLVKTQAFSIRYQRTGQPAGKIPQSLLDASLSIGTNEDARKEMRALCLPSFDYPKPVTLYQFLIEMVNLGDDIKILDYFAGSGTTGEAVLRMNEKDGGNRRFILITNNQNNICKDITIERLKRTISLAKSAASVAYYTTLPD